MTTFITVRDIKNSSTDNKKKKKITLKENPLPFFFTITVPINVQTLNYPHSSFAHHAFSPGVSRGLLRFIEGLLNEKSWPGGECGGVTPREITAIL